MGPTIFLVTQGPIIIGPHQFQKRDYTPAMYLCKYLQNMTVQAKEILHGLMAYSILQVYKVLFFYLQEYCSK